MLRQIDAWVDRRSSFLAIIVNVYVVNLLEERD